MIVLAIIFGTLIGLSLGSLGAGGSILSVPVLVHLVGLPVHTATATSLVAVGSASLVAASSPSHRVEIRWDIAGSFVVAGLFGSFAGKAVGERVGGNALLIAFSVVMIVAAIQMIRRSDGGPPDEGDSGDIAVRESVGSVVPSARSRVPALVVYAIAGTGVGFLTGLFGVGGGFVVVPVLTLVLGLSMSTAVATSLTVVAGNAVVALFVRGVGSVDWSAAGALTVPMLVGSVLGARLARHMDHQRTTQAFAGVLVAVAIANAVPAFL